MNERPWLTLVLAAAVLVTPLSTFAAPPVTLEANQSVKLSSGRTVKILSISKIEYSKGVMALLVRYETSLSVEEKKALSEEVDDVWKLAVGEVEKYRYSEAIISPNEVPKGVFITANHVLNFLYEKGSDGKWTRLNRAEFMAVQ